MSLILLGISQVHSDLDKVSFVLTVDKLFPFELQEPAVLACSQTHTLLSYVPGSLHPVCLPSVSGSLEPVLLWTGAREEVGHLINFAAGQCPHFEKS